MSQQDLFARILAALDEAALDDSTWPKCTSLLDEACGTAGSALKFSSRYKTKAFFVRLCIGGQRVEDLEREYMEKYHDIDEALPRMRAMPDGKVVHIPDLYTEKEKEASRVYNDYLVANGLLNAVTVRMNCPQESRVYWSLLHPRHDGVWKSGQIRVIRRLLPHVARFAQLRQVLFDARASRESLTQLLDSTRCGIIQLDYRGRIVQMNGYARNLLRESDGLFDKNGSLSARAPEDRKNLAKVLERALPRLGHPGVSGSVTVGRKSIRPRYLLYAVPVGEQEGNFEIARVSILILIVDPTRKTAIDPSLVAEVLGLTPSESQIASLLANGQSIREIAHSTGREESTIRWHIKHIFNKQAITRQSELIRRVLELAGYRL